MSQFEYKYLIAIMRDDKKILVGFDDGSPPPAPTSFDDIEITPYLNNLGMQRWDVVSTHTLVKNNIWATVFGQDFLAELNSRIWVMIACRSSSAGFSLPRSQRYRSWSSCSSNLR